MNKVVKDARNIVLWVTRLAMLQSIHEDLVTAEDFDSEVQAAIFTLQRRARMRINGCAYAIEAAVDAASSKKEQENE